jgi:hypothetical protein
MNYKVVAFDEINNCCITFIFINEYNFLQDMLPREEKLLII